MFLKQLIESKPLKNLLSAFSIHQPLPGQLPHIAQKNKFSPTSSLSICSRENPYNKFQLVKYISLISFLTPIHLFRLIWKIIFSTRWRMTNLRQLSWVLAKWWDVRIRLTMVMWSYPVWVELLWNHRLHHHDQYNQCNCQSFSKQKQQYWLTALYKCVYSLAGAHLCSLFSNVYFK